MSRDEATSRQIPMDLSGSTSSAEDRPVKTYPWRETALAWLESKAVSGLSLFGWSPRFGLLGSSSKMSLASYLRTEVETSRSSSTVYPTSGMAWRGGYWIASTSECPSDAVGSTLSGVLEPHAHPRFYLSPRAASGILRRAEKRGRALPALLYQALAAVARTTTMDRQDESSPSRHEQSRHEKDCDTTTQPKPTSSTPGKTPTGSTVEASPSTQDTPLTPSSQEPSPERRHTTGTPTRSLRTTLYPTAKATPTGTTDDPSPLTPKPHQQSLSKTPEESATRPSTASESPKTGRCTPSTEPADTPSHTANRRAPTDPTTETNPGSTQNEQHPLPASCRGEPHWLVRRLTPTECERLQGFPDDWTLPTAPDTPPSETP